MGHTADRHDGGLQFGDKARGLLVRFGSASGGRDVLVGQTVDVAGPPRRVGAELWDAKIVDDEVWRIGLDQAAVFAAGGTVGSEIEREDAEIRPERGGSRVGERLGRKVCGVAKRTTRGSRRRSWCRSNGRGGRWRGAGGRLRGPSRGRGRVRRSRSRRRRTGEG